MRARREELEGKTKVELAEICSEQTGHSISYYCNRFWTMRELIDLILRYEF